MASRCGIAAIAAVALLGVPTPASASAATCADVEVLFARGTFEPPGIGATGMAFVDSLRSQVGGRSVEVYAVNYPASLDFATAAEGVIDTSNRVRELSVNCPNTQIVLAGFSQGAAVIAYTTKDEVPAGYTLPVGITGPMAASVADHVAAVALFGKPSNGFLQLVQRDAPPVTVGDRYLSKTIDLCVPQDPVCSPAGSDHNAHNRYAVNGMVGEAAAFAAEHLS
ncbi:cutinase family protein [Mycolicibacterium sp.]|uniref:cutinase family protein n=1 Tax=Mycolicibacterium sp. TaxID=2320850 RepID=UPI003D116CF8